MPTIQFDKSFMWPTRAEVANERRFVDLVLPEKFKDLTVLNDALYPEIWGLVCSFLFGFYETVQITVPASSIFGSWKSGHDLKNRHTINFRQLYDCGIDRFCGPASQAPFQIDVYPTSGTASKTSRTVQGPCPFPSHRIYGNAEWIRDEHGNTFAETEPMLVEIFSSQLIAGPAYSTWHAPPNLEFNSGEDMESAMGQMTSLFKQSLFCIEYDGHLSVVCADGQNTDDDNDGINDDEPGGWTDEEDEEFEETLEEDEEEEDDDEEEEDD